MSDVSFDVLWPPAQLRKYGAGWSETVNGTSITFRLRYGDFEMLFTGDQNEFSEKALMDELMASGRLDLLRADVLKVPHHGSKHSMPEFFRAVAPVLSVASLGPEGAKSKLISGKGAWEHPSEEVIEWLGGAHRVYLTELHERRFDWATIDSAAKLERLREHAHVVVETDGNWFRVVEVAADAGSVDIPSVAQTVRGNGTRWIRAK
jgi:beta-lactamase superfamily II metal-dependent hydrolase